MSLLRLFMRSKVLQLSNPRMRKGHHLLMASLMRVPGRSIHRPGPARSQAMHLPRRWDMVKIDLPVSSLRFLNSFDIETKKAVVGRS